MTNPYNFNVKFLKIDATADGVNALLSSAGTNKKIRVLGYVVTATGAGIMIFEDTDGNDLATFQFAANGGASYAGGPDYPAFETPYGKGLQTNNAASMDIKGHLVYIVIDNPAA